MRAATRQLDDRHELAEKTVAASAEADGRDGWGNALIEYDRTRLQMGSFCASEPVTPLEHKTNTKIKTGLVAFFVVLFDTMLDIAFTLGTIRTV
jgi:hypothetical protein